MYNNRRSTHVAPDYPFGKLEINEKPSIPHGDELDRRMTIPDIYDQDNIGRKRRRQGIARQWGKGKKRIVATVACLNAALIGLIIGIYVSPHTHALFGTPDCCRLAKFHQSSTTSPTKTIG